MQITEDHEMYGCQNAIDTHTWISLFGNVILSFMLVHPDLDF